MDRSGKSVLYHCVDMNSFQLFQQLYDFSCRTKELEEQFTNELIEGIELIKEKWTRNKNINIFLY